MNFLLIPISNDVRRRKGAQAMRTSCCLQLVLPMVVAVVSLWLPRPVFGDTDDHRAYHLTSDQLSDHVRRAEAGDAAAAFRVSLYYFGRRDEEAELKWLRTAAELGSRDAQWSLGYKLVVNAYNYEEEPTPAARAEGIRWLRKAADQGDYSAQGSLGRLYEEGKAVPLDLNVALRWYQKAALSGNVWAMKKMQTFLLQGKSGRVDPIESLAWALVHATVMGEELHQVKNRFSAEIDHNGMKLAETQAAAILAVIPRKTILYDLDSLGSAKNDNRTPMAND